MVSAIEVEVEFVEGELLHDEVTECLALPGVCGFDVKDVEEKVYFLLAWAWNFTAYWLFSL